MNNLRYNTDAFGNLIITDGVWQWRLHGERVVIGPQPPTQPPAGRVWDARLDRRGVTLHPVRVQSGQTYWRLVRADYRDRAQAQGKHHIYVDVLNESGQRVTGARLVARWDGGEAAFMSEAKPGEEAATNFPMFATGYGYSVKMDGPSDEVRGMGLGDIGSEHMAEHVAYFLVFQRAIGA